MSIKPIPPRPGKSPYWYGRGSHLGQFVDRSTKAVRRSVALQVIKKWEREIECGQFAVKGEPTFLSAAIAYKKSGGDGRHVGRLIGYFGKDRLLKTIDQAAIKAAAEELFPNGSASTRNRQVYTPISAILKSAGIDFKIERPKGSRGKVLDAWLWPEEAERLFSEADKINPEFGIFCRFLCYTGLRLKEATQHFRCNNLRLSEGFAFIPQTKNGKPRPVHLPPHIVAALANHPRGLDRPGQQVFRWHKSGRMYLMLAKAAANAKVTLPPRCAFHIFRHTYGTWMRRYAGLDVRGLVGTGTWKSEQSAARYAHVVAGEEARRADLLPVNGSGSKSKDSPRSELPCSGIVPPATAETKKTG